MSLRTSSCFCSSVSIFILNVVTTNHTRLREQFLIGFFAEEVTKSFGMKEAAPRTHHHPADC